MIEKYSVTIDDDFEYEFPGDSIKEEWKNAAGQLHRIGAAALTIRAKRTGELLKQQWVINGSLDREEGPAYVEKHKRSSKHPDCVTQKWYREGSLDRPEGGPAIVTQHTPSGIYVEEHYLTRSHAHRIDGPSIIRRDPHSGITIEEDWNLNGVGTRTDGPQQVLRDKDTGIAYYVHYAVNGRGHRTDGPSFIGRDPKTGQITELRYQLKGKFVPPFEHGGVDAEIS